MVTSLSVYEISTYVCMHVYSTIQVKTTHSQCKYIQEKHVYVIVVLSVCMYVCIHVHVVLCTVYKQ